MKQKTEFEVIIVGAGPSGLAAALILAFRGKGLLPVALTACGTVFLCERLLALIG